MVSRLAVLRASSFLAAAFFTLCGFAQDELVPAVPTPEYGFETGPINQWLVFGPIVRGEEFSDPVAQLDNPQEGKRVALPNKEFRRWSVAESNSNGALLLGSIGSDFYRLSSPKVEIYENNNHKVVYAYCKVVGELGTKRQILVGLDDGGRAWMDGKLVMDDVKAGWLRLYEHSIEVDFSEKTEQELLFEVHNWTGDFSLYCYGGYRLRGRALFEDGITPVANSLVRISVEGEATQAIPTNASGQFEARAVPFNQPLQIDCLGSSIEWPPYSRPEFDARVTDNQVDMAVTPPFDFSVSVARLPIPPGVYEAMIETAKGEVIVANMADHSLYTFNGRSFKIHPDKQLQNFTHGTVKQLVEAPGGDLWIATSGDGLFRYSNGDLQHWKSEDVGQENYALTVLSNGDVMTSFRRRVNKPEHAVFRIPKGTTELHVVDLPECNPIWSIAERQHPLNGLEVLFVPRLGSIIAQGQTGPRTIDVPAFAELSAVAAGEDDSLWFAGLGLFRLDVNDSWERIDIASVDHGEKLRKVYRDPDGATWFVSTSAVYCYHGGVMHRNVAPANSGAGVHSCMTRDGTICLTERSGIVHSIRRSTRIEYDFRYGLHAGRVMYLSKMGKQIYVSQDSSQPLVLSGGQFRSLPRADDYLSDNLVVHGLSGNRLLAVPVLHASAGHMHNTSLPPLIKEVDESGWKKMDNSIWGGAINAYIFCKELADGRILLSTRHGIAEVENGKLVASKLLDGVEQPGIALAALQDSSGGVWIVTCSGQVVRVADGKMTSNVFPCETNCSGTTITEHDGYVWIGNASGLFRSPLAGGPIEKLSHRLVRTLSVVGLETGVTPGRLWIIGRHGEVIVVNEETQFAQLQLFDKTEVRVVNSTAADDDGRLWLAMESGLQSFHPSSFGPQLFVESLNGIESLADIESGASVGDILPIECDYGVNVLLAARDDDAEEVSVRYRVNGGVWQFEEEAMTEAVRLTFAEPGTHQVDFQAYDGSWNTSNIATVKFNAFRPIWRSSLFQSSVVCLLVTALGLAAFLMYQVEAARRSRNRLRETLLAEESRARALAEETSRERAMLLARVCHDLRNPLSVVGVVRDLLGSFGTSSDPAQLASLLEQSASNMKYLTDQLLTYSRSRAAGKSLNLESVEICDFVDDFRKVAKLRLKESSVRFASRVDGEVPASIVTDSQVLREILGNIFDNAVRHTERGEITLRCSYSDSGGVAMCISDTGGGMPPEMVAAVFEPFFRGNAKPRSPDGSIGLGMYIVHELTEQLGGKVVVNSEVGTGTTVSLELPSLTVPVKLDYKHLRGPRGRSRGQRRTVAK